MRTSNKLAMKISATRYSNMPGCKGKQQFPTPEEAQKAVDRYKLSFKNDDSITYYQCQGCNLYHIGHPTPQAEELEYEHAGKFIRHEGLLYAKILDPNSPQTFWVFVVPEGTAEDESDVMEKGVLVAYKQRGDMWREQGGKRSDNYQLFNLCAQMSYGGALVDFVSRLERHRDHMVNLSQLKMDLLNGMPMPALPQRQAEEPIPAPVQPQLRLPTHPAEAEMHKGRAVFRTAEGKPYHRTYKKCSVAGCGTEIELRAYIAVSHKDGTLTTQHRWLPVDSRATERRSGGPKRTHEWVCGACMSKALTAPSAPAKTAEQSSRPTMELVRRAPHPAEASSAPESCEHCGKAGHDPVDCPTLLKEELEAQKTALAKAKEEIADMRTAPESTKRKIVAETDRNQVLARLQKIALNRAMTPEFVRGASLMACQLLNPLPTEQFHL